MKRTNNAVVDRVLILDHGVKAKFQRFESFCEGKIQNRERRGVSQDDEERRDLLFAAESVKPGYFLPVVFLYDEVAIDL